MESIAPKLRTHVMKQPNSDSTVRSGHRCVVTFRMQFVLRCEPLVEPISCFRAIYLPETLFRRQSSAVTTRRFVPLLNYKKKQYHLLQV